MVMMYDHIEWQDCLEKQKSLLCYSVYLALWMCVS